MSFLSLLSNDETLALGESTNQYAQAKAIKKYLKALDKYSNASAKLSESMAECQVIVVEKEALLRKRSKIEDSLKQQQQQPQGEQFAAAPASSRVAYINHWQNELQAANVSMAALLRRQETMQYKITTNEKKYLTSKLFLEQHYIVAEQLGVTRENMEDARRAQAQDLQEPMAIEIAHTAPMDLDEVE